MQGIKKYVIPLVLMSLFSLVMLIGLSLVTYLLKWTAKEAMMGIILIYIATGFVGGKIRKKMSYEMGMGKKLVDGVITGILYMLLLLLLSIFFVNTEFMLTSRFMLILFLVVGSTALGRIL